MKKYGSTIARNYYTFTEIYHDEWFDGTINNLKDNPFEISSAEAFKKQDGFTLRESISYNYLCYLLFHNLKKTNVFQHLTKLQDKTWVKNAGIAILTESNKSCIFCWVVLRFYLQT